MKHLFSYCSNNSGGIKLFTTYTCNFFSLGVLLNPRHQTDLASPVTAPNHSVLSCKLSFFASKLYKIETAKLQHRMGTTMCNKTFAYLIYLSMAFVGLQYVHGAFSGFLHSPARFLWSQPGNAVLFATENVWKF